MRARAGLVAAWLAALAIAVWQPLASGLRLGFGDRADALITIALLEHWRNVWRGAAVWNLPRYFHPYTDTLGYNDGYFLIGLVHSFWRLWFDPFVSDTLDVATFRTIGFFATYALARRILGWARPLATLIAILFTIANGMAVQAVHGQLQTTALVPVFALLVAGAIGATRAGRVAAARVRAVAAALLIGLWLMTAFYAAWFALFFCLTGSLCWLWTSGNRSLRKAAAVARAHRGTIAITGGALAIGVLPFLYVYLPKLAETGGHGYMISYLVTPLDPVNVGPGNYLWGWLFQGARAIFVAIVGPESPLPEKWLGGEHETGFPLFLFALLVAGLIGILRSPARFAPEWRAFALAVLVSWGLTLQLWILSPWIAVHFLVPGAGGIRVVLRYQLFLILPVLLIAFGAHRAAAVDLWRRRRATVLLAAALLVGEQLGSRPVAELDRAVQLADLGTITPPPRGCRSFYVVAARRHETDSRNPASPLRRSADTYRHNVDAMYLAQRWQVPTLNGFSTFNPPDWNFAAPLAPDYDARMLGYARRHALHGVCRLDVRAAQPWRFATP